MSSKTSLSPLRGATFKVSNVTPNAHTSVLTTSGFGFHHSCGIGRSSAAPKLICPDAISPHPGFLKYQPHGNGFVSAVLFAFNYHLPLTLRPEHFWILILQSVAQHVNANAEQLRSEFVTFQGKKKLVVRRDNFVLGATGNDWVGVVREFGEQISNNTRPGAGALLLTDFSSSTDTEIVAGQVTVMDMVQKFFDFEVFTMCGFPHITLEGTSGDWHALRSKAEALIQKKCLPEFSKRWLPALTSVLDRLSAQYDDPSTVDIAFWESFCKMGGGGGSGSNRSIDGWINVFFPILTRDEINEFCAPYDEKSCGQSEISWKTGPAEDAIPSGFALAPVVWNYYGTEVPLEFRSGFVGAVLRSDGSISPDLGWYIARKEE